MLQPLEEPYPVGGACQGGLEDNSPDQTLGVRQENAETRTVGHETLDLKILQMHSKIDLLIKVYHNVNPMQLSMYHHISILKYTHYYSIHE